MHCEDGYKDYSMSIVTLEAVGQCDDHLSPFGQGTPLSLSLSPEVP